MVNLFLKKTNLTADNLKLLLQYLASYKVDA